MYSGLLRAIPLFILIAMLSGTCSYAESDPDGMAMKAYELRMNGKADEAVELLEKVVKEDPTVAAAHYELARSKHHMWLATHDDTGLESIRLSVERALELDPDQSARGIRAAAAGEDQVRHERE